MQRVNRFPGVPVLMYHDISTEPSPISISPAAFEANMSMLHEGGYRVLSLDALIDTIRSHATLPRRSVVLTFDDGFESTYAIAFPTLARYGFSATVFLVPDYCGTRNTWPHQPSVIPPRTLMSWSQVHEMAHHGFVFGAHTCTHPRLDRITAHAAQDEIFRSKTAIEDRLGSPVRHFAYPYGRLNKHSQALVGSAFDSGCGTSPGLVNSTSNLLALERIDALYLHHRISCLGLSSRTFALFLELLKPLRRGRSMLARRAW